MGVGLDEEVNFCLVGIEAEVLVSEVEPADGGVFVPDGAFDVIGGFPLEFGVFAVDEDG